MDSAPKVNFAAEEWHVHQIYISDLENELDLSDMNVFLGVLALSYIVTVERTEVPAEYVSEHIDLMLNIDSESFWNLRHTDQVKFSKDLVVFSASKNNMAVTIPDDFNGDVEID
jgi:hypothetical protein